MLTSLLNMQTVIPSKDSIIQGVTMAAKVFSAIAGFSAYIGYIPAKYAGLAVLLFGIASSFKEICTSILAYSRGEKVTLTPPAPVQPK